MINSLRALGWNHSHKFYKESKETLCGDIRDQVMMFKGYAIITNIQ